jgi:O-succinylbenzoate synthase
MWDLQSKQQGKRIRDLFNTPARPIESGLAVGIYDTIDELLERIALYLSEGAYKRVKIKIAPGWDIAPLEAVRERFRNFPLMVDANAAYDLAKHKDILLELDRFDLMMIEQPLAANALDDSAELARLIKTPICLDESAEMNSLDKIISLKSASIINIKVQRVGGLWNAVQMLNRARETGLACWLGTMPELGIASAQALEIASLPGFVYPTDIESSSRWFLDDIIEPSISVQDGIVKIPANGYSIYRSKLDQNTTYSQRFEA